MIVDNSMAVRVFPMRTIDKVLKLSTEKKKKQNHHWFYIRKIAGFLKKNVSKTVSRLQVFFEVGS